MFYLVGLGLENERGISIQALEILKRCESVLLESYTSFYSGTREELEGLIGKKVIIADRELVENGIDSYIEQAKHKDIAILIIGDPLSATTHVDMLLRCREKGTQYKVIHNAGIFNAIADTGLSLYKFGKITSIPFGENVETPYNIIKENGKAHTLVLLDLKPEEKITMSFGEGIKRLLDIEKRKKEKVFTENNLVVCCAALGREETIIKFGEAREFINKDPKIYPQCFVVVGELHFIEEEMLENYK